jgi:hypothetical protein
MAGQFLASEDVDARGFPYAVISSLGDQYRRTGVLGKIERINSRR